MNAAEDRTACASTGTDASPPDASGPESLPVDMARRRVLDRDVLIVSCFVVMMAFMMKVTPEKDGVTLFGKRLPESCAVRILTDYRCAGCGLTRSFILGVRGDPAAFQVHPVGPVLLLLVVLQIPLRARRLLRLRALRRAGLVDLEIHEVSAIWRVFRTGLFLVFLAVWVINLWLGRGPP